jgi:S-formylglutathione hydrolase FrmB
VRRTVATLLAGAALSAPAAPASGAGTPSCVARTAPVAIGIKERSRSVSGRVITLTLRSRALAADQTVNVLLPAKFDRSGRTRYPVLYLLHGAGGDNRTWLDQDDAQAALGSLPVIAVMPDGSTPSTNGGYTDWFGFTAGSPAPAPAWESYHVRELVPFIDRAFPTRRGPAGRAIAGISMGGTGAMKYAGEFPGTFGYAGSFSGGLDAAVGRGRDGNCKWGEFPRDEVVWRDNNPTDLAPNLRGVRLYVRSGDGTPGPFDTPSGPLTPTRLATEAGAHVMAQNFVAAARKAKVAGVDADFYPGSHSHPYWQREFRGFVAWLRAQLRDRVTAPSAFTVASAHIAFSAWGWSFGVAGRPAREFLYVRKTRSRLTLRGSGRVRVRPPRGRAFDVDLGPGHREQQSSFDAAATKDWRTVTTPLEDQG